MLSISKQILTEGFVTKKEYGVSPAGDKFVFTREDGKKITLTPKELSEYLKKNPPDGFETFLKSMGHTVGGGSLGGLSGGLIGAALSGGSPDGITIGAKLGTGLGAVGGSILGLRNHGVGLINKAGRDKVLRSRKK